MRTFRNSLLQTWGWLLSTLLGTLGFSSCHGDDPVHETYMYGTLMPYFTIKGKVVDSRQQALADIRVIVAKRDIAVPNAKLPVITKVLHDTLYTDSQGEFIWGEPRILADTVRYELHIADTGIEHAAPHYQADTVRVEFTGKSLIPSENGDTGKIMDKSITITLKPRDEEP